MSRPLYIIARDIKNNWKNVNFAAVPYLAAMRRLNDVSETFGFDYGEGIVTRFLCNASTWRGNDAKRIKAELKDILKAYHATPIN